MILSNIAPIAKNAIARNLFNDPLLFRRVTYRRFKGNTYDRVTGKNVPSVDEVPSLKVVEMKHTEDSVKASTAKVEVGMLLFLIQYDDISFIPTTKDTILDTTTGIEYLIRGVDKIFNILYSITVTDKRTPTV